MPFPFRNPVNPSYDDGSDGGQQQADPKLEGIVQKMIDAGEPEENIASVIKQYKSTPSSNTPASTVKPTTGTGRGSGPTPNPDDEWWKGFGGSLFAPTNDSMNHAPEAIKAGEKGALGWAKGAIADIPSTVMGGLKTVGGLLTNPSQTMSDVGQSLKILPGQIADTTAKAGSDPFAFGEMAGQMGGQPLMTDVMPGMIKTGLPSVGRGLQNVGDFVSKNQPITGMAPPFATPRTLRFMEKGVGKAVNYAGRGVESIGNKMNNPVTDIDLAKPIVNNASGESSASMEALSRQSSMKGKGQQYYVYDRTGQGRPIIGPDAVDYTAKKGETYGILNKDGTFQKLDDNGGRPPASISQNQAKAGAIQSNIDDKYGPGNTDKASSSTRDTLNKTKQSIPVINRPGTFITLKSPTPDMIQQAQKLGYEFDSKASDGQKIIWRMRQTGRPMTINSAPTNTTMHNIDLNAPVNIGGGSF